MQTRERNPTSRHAPLPEAETLHHILRHAGEAALSRFRRVARRSKSDGSPVTEADLEAQERIAEGLSRAFPGVPIVGEEDGLEDDPGHGLRWYVDPIDGTAAYLEGLAHWGPTIGLVDDEGPLLGALYLPRLDELWIAGRNQGAWRNGERLAPPQVTRPRRSDVVYVPSRFHQIGPFPWIGKVRALGSTAVHLAQVASGAGVAAIVGRWSPWDVACGILLVEEAGRVLTDLRAEPLSPLGAVPTPAGEAAPRRHHPAFLAGDPVIVEYIAALARDALDAGAHG